MILKPELSVAFGFLGLLVGSCGEKLVRMTISPQKTTVSATSAELMADLKVDGQDITVLVDTGSPYTFFVEKQWYERTHPGGCAELKFKCYDCDPSSCHEGPTKTHEFFGGSQVTVFQHSGTVDFGTASADGIDFGLVVGCNESPFAALGLSPPSAKSKPYVPLIYQLLAKPKSQRLIEKSVFSVYLNAGKDPSGELILGGEDKSKYTGPLRYVKVVNKEEQSIMVTDLGIGDASKNRIKVSQAGYLDTGTNVIEMPDKLKTPVLQLLRTAGKKPVTITENAGFYELSCGDSENLPSITFFLKEDSLLPNKVPLEIPPASYVNADVDSSCTLAIEFAGTWLLGLPTLIGNYHLYDWDKSRIGVAKVR
ncbi:hypothetical protein FOZ63_000815 [Perkinsus olseni]|uniref:Peptidase A1 domain-containing protein n=1 Tax=Perkinsus olseni TaxID=32597 RepID=A0A7J6P553_PEROL|nr:hypothetical protein FOZ60_015931 [Perkinsus olseni]KAF4698128.1 hypothetical protein FOZ63_000815 [Perkinsus olseni]KAF4717205.1 hypothetical protein FOZ62_031928 [Perkinsus olseni]